MSGCEHKSRLELNHSNKEPQDSPLLDQLFNLRKAAFTYLLLATSVLCSSSVLSHWVSAGSKGLFGHVAELAVGILGDWTTLSLTSQDEDETNGHFMGLSVIKPKWWTYKFIPSALLLEDGQIAHLLSTYCTLYYKWSFELPLKHDTAALSKTIKKHNDISRFLAASHFTAPLVILIECKKSLASTAVVSNSVKTWKHHSFHKTATQISLIFNTVIF